MRTFPFHFTIALALFVATPRVHSEDAITLKKQWQIGKSYSQTMKMEQSMNMEINGQKMDQKMNMTVDMTAAVQAPAEGKGKLLALTYDRMIMDIDMNGQETKMDSQSKPSEGGENPFAAFIGKEIKFVLDENDNVKGFENLDKILGTASAKNPIFAAFLNEDSLKKTIEQSSLHALPGRPVKTGDTWDFTVDLPLPQIGHGVLKGKYTYKGTTPHGGVSCAEIAMDGTLSLDMSALNDKPGNPIGQLGMKIDDSKMNGTVWFDNALGAARGSEIHQEMKLEMNNPAQNGEKLSIPIKQVISTELTKVGDAH